MGDQSEGWPERDMVSLRVLGLGLAVVGFFPPPSRIGPMLECWRHRKRPLKRLMNLLAIQMDLLVRVMSYSEE